uniref:ribosomal protein S7 n=1 Tax=Calidiella yingdensis TaxID=3031288 RepID=UPI0024113D38|nr:ribosomal protein S7 [Calidiella yingdensis]WDY13079.1 ribosomal protein S7 [Calidiella yingdensis]
MARRRTPTKNSILPDPIYQNRLVEMLVNNVMKKGKKSLAYRLCYKAMSEIEKITDQDAVLVIEEAVRNVTPLVIVKARRIGGATHQVPLRVDPEQGSALAIRWILSASRNRSGRDMASNLTNELLDASKRMGNAVRKKDEVHKMAEANKAFAKHRF